MEREVELVNRFKSMVQHENSSQNIYSAYYKILNGIVNNDYYEAPLTEKETVGALIEITKWAEDHLS